MCYWILFTMAARSRVSLRTKRPVKEPVDVIVIDDDNLDEVKSPTRNPEFTVSPRFRSPLATPLSKKGGPKSNSQDTSNTSNEDSYGMIAPIFSVYQLVCLPVNCHVLPMNHDLSASLPLTMSLSVSVSVCHNGSMCVFIVMT